MTHRYYGCASSVSRYACTSLILPSRPSLQSIKSISSHIVIISNTLYLLVPPLQGPLSNIAQSEMSTDDTHSQSYNQWAALQSRQPLYVYPGSQPPEGSSLQTPLSASHDQSPDVPSYNYSPSYDQISRSSSLLPSSSQYSHSETPQLQHPSYSTPSYSDTHEPRHDYFPASQNSFDPAAVSTITTPPYRPPTVPGTYSSSHFPSHQFPELRPAHNYAGSSLPPIITPEAFAPAISTLDASHHHTPNSAASNKRQRSEDQDQDEGDNVQGRGDTAMSLADKLKRACARCRGLKVGYRVSVPNRLESNPVQGPLPLQG